MMVVLAVWAFLILLSCGFFHACEVLDRQHRRWVRGQSLDRWWMLDPDDERLT